MPYLDLDFKEKRCNFPIFFLITLLLLSLLTGIYLNIRTKKQLILMKKEANLIFESTILARGFIKKGSTEIALVSINGKNYVIKSEDTIVVDDVPVYITLTDTTINLKSIHFKRSLKW